MVVEVLSPGNSRREMKDKFDLYESAGVLEYWIIDPLREQILLYDLGSEGTYAGRQPYLARDTVPSKVLIGLEIAASALVREEEGYSATRFLYSKYLLPNLFYPTVLCYLAITRSLKATVNVSIPKNKHIEI
ncbi:MAG: Uma2 family endonuclease [Bacteroidota bacterium]